MAFLYGNGSGQVGNGNGLSGRGPGSDTGTESSYHGIARAHGVELTRQGQPHYGFGLVVGHVQNTRFTPRNQHRSTPLLPQLTTVFYAPVEVGVKGKVEVQQPGQFGRIDFESSIGQRTPNVAHIGHAPHRRKTEEQGVELVGAFFGQQGVRKLLVDKQQIELGQCLFEAHQQGRKGYLRQVIIRTKIDPVCFLPTAHRFRVHAGIPAGSGYVQVFGIDAQLRKKMLHLAPKEVIPHAANRPHIGYAQRHQIMHHVASAPQRRPGLTTPENGFPGLERCFGRFGLNSGVKIERKIAKNAHPQVFHLGKERSHIGGRNHQLFSSKTTRVSGKAASGQILIRGLSGWV